MFLPGGMGSRVKLSGIYEEVLVRVWLAGASGVMGTRLIPLLLGAGHEVVGMMRTDSNAPAVEQLGAIPVVCDVFDRDALLEEVVAWAPTLVMHQLTDLPDDASLIQSHLPATARIRTEGTLNLLEAAKAAGASRFLAQSVAWLPVAPGSPVAQMEEMVLEFGGLVLRYGQWYGPGTYYETELPPAPRIHIDRAAERTVSQLTANPGIVTVVED
jgi:nucleoside-diphosphate-sugar epimerase